MAHTFIIISSFLYAFYTNLGAGERTLSMLAAYPSYKILYLNGLHNCLQHLQHDKNTGRCTGRHSDGLVAVPDATLPAVRILIRVGVEGSSAEHLTVWENRCTISEI